MYTVDDKYYNQLHCLHRKTCGTVNQFNTLHIISNGEYVEYRRSHEMAQLMYLHIAMVLYMEYSMMINNEL